MRHIIPISGKDSLATAIWQRGYDPTLPYEYVFNDTRAELPETYEWLDKVESKLGIKIHRIGKSLENIIKEQAMLPSALVRFCTRLAKIKPMDEYIGKDKAMVYYGLRADEPERIGSMKTSKLTPRYPLREANIGLATVNSIVGTYNDLMPPAFFWKRLYDDTVERIGGVDSPLFLFIQTWPQWVRDRMFAWRSRPNCFFCFFQRRYEWVGLLEHHPMLFDLSEQIEIGTGYVDRRIAAFTWIKDYPLSKIRANAEAIYQKRLEAVVKTIRQKEYSQYDLFSETVDDMDESQVSCGLLCGK